MSTVDIETILMEVGHRVSLMQSGKTLAPFMFKEEADQIRTTLKAELLAKMPNKTVNTEYEVGYSSPEDLAQTSWQMGKMNGRNEAITEITKILEEL